MNKRELPKTDSIKRLAEFWDSHDLTDFEDELKEATEPVLARRTAIKVPLEEAELEAVEQMAQAEGVSREELVHAGCGKSSSADRVNMRLSGDHENEGSREP